MRHKGVKGHRGSIYMSDSATHGKVYEVAFRDRDGKRHFKTVGPDLKEAIAEAARIRVKLGKGEKAHYQKMTFGAVFEEWSDTRLGPERVSNTTAKKYRAAAENYLVPVFGTRQIRSITTDDIAIFLQRVRTKRSGKVMSGSTKQGVYIVLYAVMDYAANERRGYIPRNPCDSLEAGERPQIGEQEHRIFQPGETKLILDNSEAWFHPILLTGLHTGMRIGEILGLKWEHVDFEKNQIHVRGQLLKTGEYTATKGRCNRTIDLLASLRPVLLELPSRFQGGWVFPDAKHWKVTEEFVKARTAAGIPDGDKPLSTHSCRHTFASALLRDGKDVAWVSSQLGHKSIKTTLDTYAHVIQRDNRTEEAALRLAEALGDLG